MSAETRECIAVWDASAHWFYLSGLWCPTKGQLSDVTGLPCAWEHTVCNQEGINAPPCSSLSICLWQATTQDWERLPILHPQQSTSFIMWDSQIFYHPKCWQCWLINLYRHGWINWFIDWMKFPKHIDGWNLWMAGTDIHGPWMISMADFPSGATRKLRIMVCVQ